MNKRPIGISILAVLHLIAGLVLAGLLLLLIAKFEMIAQASDLFGIPPALFVLALVFLMALSVASSIGMWRGAGWGWWLGAFNCSYGVTRAAGGLLFLHDFGGAEGGIGLSDATYRRWAIKFSGRIVVCSLLFLYFFRPNVLAYFGREQLGRAKAAGILVASTLTVVVLINAIAWLWP